MSYTDYAARIIMGNGDTPADDVSSILEANYLSTTPVQPYDVIVSGSTLRANPSSAAPSYITWMTRRASVSQLKIIIEGSYRNIWLKMVGMESTFINAPNGWLTMSTLYDGSGTPGAGKNGNGCAVGVTANRSSGTYVATFGPQNSSYAVNNAILLRLRLESLDVVKAITITGMVNNPDVVW